MAPDTDGGKPGSLRAGDRWAGLEADLPVQLMPLGSESGSQKVGRPLGSSEAPNSGWTDGGTPEMLPKQKLTMPGGVGGEEKVQRDLKAASLGH